MDVSLLSSQQSTEAAGGGSSGGEETREIETARLSPHAPSILAQVFRSLHITRMAHSSATTALLIGQVLMYTAMFLPLATTTSLQGLENYANMNCTSLGDVGSTLTFYTNCASLDKDEIYVQDEYGVAYLYRYHCTLNNGTSDAGASSLTPARHGGQHLEILEEMQQMMSEEHNWLFVFLPFLKTIDTFLVVFFLKSALGVILAHGIYGLALCMSYRLDVTKRQIIKRSRLPYAYLIFIFIAMSIYAFAYLVMATSVDDVCVLDRRIDFTLLMSTMPGLLVAVVGLIFHLYAQRKRNKAMLRELYCFDPVRPYRWFHVLCKEHYDHAAEFGTEMKTN